MAFIDRVLQQPSYGWQQADGALIVPTRKQLLREALSRMNVFQTKKNWSAAIGWFWVICLLPVVVLCVAKYFTWWTIPVIIAYGAIMATHGTIWYHRYCTHFAYKFKNSFWRFVTQNLVVKLIPEEIYVVSHHVHHAKSDSPGDPYNATAGFWYCFLADTNHQPIAKDMDEADYLRTSKFLKHTGIYINSYAQYRRWGSVSNPWVTVLHWLLNWAFWFAAMMLIGGPELAFACFTGAFFWVIAVRNFNYAGHGKGKDERQDGMDYNRRDMSINQYRPGLIAGEWHNNHHLYPSSARTGFLPLQLDMAWVYIYCLYKIGAISSYHDSKANFLRDYHGPNKLAMVENEKVARENEKALAKAAAGREN